MATSRVGVTAFMAAGCAALLAGTALACGDKLVALGGGVGFDRVIVSRHPGHIVLMLEPATGLAEANEKLNLAGSLSLAGHEVFVARNAEELRAHRLAVAPDLILVDAGRASGIQPQPVADKKDPVILPVAFAPSSELTSKELEGGCVVVIEGKKGAQLLKRVERVLKLRSRGEAMTCDKNVESQQV
jgi:hypothetical protein